MKRRSFIKKSGKAAASLMAAPYILPSGRLFARSGTRLVNHVVFVLFAGGIRNQESVYQQYLLNQTGGPTGNVMLNMLEGAAPPASSLVYNEWTPALSSSLAAQGTLFQNLRYAQGPTGHYNGHTVAITGNYTDTSLNLNINPEFPTVFEYYRKHTDPSKNAMDCWWMSTELGPYPSLNYSRHPEYGSIYGANFLMPGYGVQGLAEGYFGSLSALHPEELGRVGKVRDFLNGHFDKEANDIPGIQNLDADKTSIQGAYLDVLNDTEPLEWPLPPGIPSYELTGDLVNIAASWRILDKFAPELMVVNTTNLDVCHDNFSLYLDLLHRADYGVGWLWDKIQSHPVLANDTVMICMPEHGRNLEPNGLFDGNGFRAYDHTSDENSRDVFALIAGPPSVINQGLTVGTTGSPVGESVDIVPTIAHLLGFDDAIPSGFLPGRVLEEAIV